MSVKLAPGDVAKPATARLWAGGSSTRASWPKLTTPSWSFAGKPWARACTSGVSSSWAASVLALRSAATTKVWVEADARSADQSGPGQ